jgi:hypothetical protein
MVGHDHDVFKLKKLPSTSLVGILDMSSCFNFFEGRDATSDFEGTGQSESAKELMQTFCTLIIQDMHEILLDLCN